VHEEGIQKVVIAHAKGWQHTDMPAQQEATVHEGGVQKVMVLHGPDAKSSNGERQGPQQDSMHSMHAEGLRKEMTLQCVWRHRSAKLVQASRIGVGLGRCTVQAWTERS
jgi:hypothetical protein